MHYTFLIVLKFSLHQTKGLVIICNGYSTVTQMEACSLTLHIEDILMLNSSWFFLCLFLLLFYPPPPKKKPQKKQLLVNLLIYILTFLSYVYLHVCMSSYITLHVTTCIGYFFFFETQTIPFFQTFI